MVAIRITYYINVIDKKIDKDNTKELLKKV